MTEKTKLFIDMDGVLADFMKGVREHPDYKISFKNDTLDQLDVFGLLEPMDGAIEAVNKILNSGLYDVHIATTPPWNNPQAWMHKRLWIDKYLPKLKKRITMTHNKDLLCQSPSDIIIDDRLKNGVERWKGVHLHFGTDECKTWKNVLDYLNI